MKKFGLVLVCLLFVTGCGSTKGSSVSLMGYEEAENICINNYESGDVVKSYLDMDDGKATYEIEILTDENLYSCEIDAENGNILEQESDAIVQTTNDYQEALARVTDEFGNVKVLSVEYDREDDEYEFSLQNNKYRLEVTVKNNEVISSEQEPIRYR